MGVNTVFFDVGNTLMHACPTVSEMFVQVARERGHDVTIRDVEPFMSEVDAYYEAEYVRDGDFWCTHERATAIWHDMYRLLARLCGLESDSEALAAAVYERYRKGDAWSVYEDVVPCLKTLRSSGYRLAVISNWDAELESLLRSVKLLPYFDEVVSSAVVGYRKPDHVIFDLALERMGVKASQAVHVGDLPEADGAASRVGITPVILDRKSVHGSCGFRVVETLTDLPGVLESLR